MEERYEWVPVDEKFAEALNIAADTKFSHGDMVQAYGDYGSGIGMWRESSAPTKPMEFSPLGTLVDGGVNKDELGRMMREFLLEEQEQLKSRQEQCPHENAFGLSTVAMYRMEDGRIMAICPHCSLSMIGTKEQLEVRFKTWPDERSIGQWLTSMPE